MLSRYRYEQVHMGMPVIVALYAADEQTANLSADHVFARFAELDRRLSDYQADSELSRLSATAGSGTAVVVSDDLWNVLDRSQQLAVLTDGAFDVTIGPLTRLWRRSKRQRALPSDELLAPARAAVGYRALRLDTDGHTALLERPNMRLDLGGIAAGFAVDEGLRILREQGITRALIDASGDIGVGDAPPDAAGWRLELAEGASRSAGLVEYVILANAAITTSGDAFQFVDIQGQRYSHIVDPKTGLGLTRRRSCTVVARDCTTADSWATALCVLGPERGAKLIAQRPELAVRFVEPDNSPHAHGATINEFGDFQMYLQIDESDRR